MVTVLRTGLCLEGLDLVAIIVRDEVDALLVAPWCVVLSSSLTVSDLASDATAAMCILLQAQTRSTPAAIPVGP